MGCAFGVSLSVLIIWHVNMSQETWNDDFNGIPFPHQMEDKNFNHILHRYVPPSLEDKDHEKKLHFASEG